MAHNLKTLAYFIAATLLLLVLLWLTTDGASGQGASDPVLVTDCWQVAADQWDAGWYWHTGLVNWQPRWNWDGLAAMRGVDIWLGYPEGFDWPPDTWLVALWKVHTPDGWRWVEFWQAPSQPDTLYALPYTSRRAYARADGRYYGIHPCGAFRVVD